MHLHVAAAVAVKTKHAEAASDALARVLHGSMGAPKAAALLIAHCLLAPAWLALCRLCALMAAQLLALHVIACGAAAAVKERAMAHRPAPYSRAGSMHLARHTSSWQLCSWESRQPGLSSTTTSSHATSSSVNSYSSTASSSHDAACRLGKLRVVAQPHVGSPARTGRDQDSHQRCTLPLPPQSAQHAGRLTVVLDLDETLVCSYRLDQLPSRLRPRLHSPLTTLVHFGPLGNAATTIVLMERPGMRAFLSRLSTFAELVLFTAGASGYALPLARHIDPTGELFGNRLLFRDVMINPAREAGSKGSGGGWGPSGSSAAFAAAAPIKDLSRLGRPLARTLLVDNSLASFMLQPANGVPCQPFRGAETDCQLLGVILPLLTSLAEARDLRPVLAGRFQLAAWFRARGVPVEDDVGGQARLRL